MRSSSNTSAPVGEATSEVAPVWDRPLEGATARAARKVNAMSFALLMLILLLLTGAIWLLDHFVLRKRRGKGAPDRPRKAVKRPRSRKTPPDVPLGQA